MTKCLVGAAALIVTGIPFAQEGVFSVRPLRMVIHIGPGSSMKVVTVTNLSSA